MSYIRRRWPIKKTLAYQEDVGLSRRRWPICWCCLDRGPGSFDVEDATTLSWSSAAVSEWVSESYSHETASSSAECSRDKLPFSFFRGQDLTMWNIIWVSPQGHRSLSVSCHFLLQAPQCPCSVQKWFSRDHCCRGRWKPGCQIVGSHTRWELTIWADFQLCLHRLLMSTGYKSCHSGFLDVSRSNGGLRKDIGLDWLTVMFDDFLHQLVSGSLPS